MKDVIVIKTWLDTKWKKMVFSVLFLVILNYAIYAVTSFNFFEMGIKSFLDTMGIYTEEVKSVTMESSGFENGDSGHYHVTKSAEWTGLDSAYVDFYIESELQSNEKYKDVVFILDISGSMAGEKIQLIQEHSLELTEKLLKEPKNSIALISFSDEAHILTGFTNDINVSDPIIENLEVGGNTNYYDALLALEDVLEGYQEKEDTDLMVLFLSDGYPTAFNPSQQAQYQLIKSLYPSITIQGIQYEMGIEIVDAIKEISDNQFIIDLNVVNNILFQAAFEPKYYEAFELVDYIDYEHFYLESVDDVEVPFGEVSLTEENGVQKVTWLVGPNTWQTGTKQRMRINLKTKEQYVGTEGFYPTNYSESFSAEIVNGEEPIIVESTLTPVLKSGYKVNYYSNSPEGCSTNDFDEVHYAFENVTISNTSPVCEGYVFKGWDTKDSIKYINSDVFRMPTRDVDFYGTWTKLGINKTMDGTVTQKVTLYKTIQEKAVLDNEASTYVSSSTGINLANISSDTNGKGVYTIANTANNTYPIHYYRGAVTDNNVLFGGYCWLIVRTTDTGGIKIVYNGEPEADGSCLGIHNGDSTNNDIGKSVWTSKMVSTDWTTHSMAYDGYMYGTVYQIGYSNTGTKYYGRNVSYSGGKYTISNRASSTLATAITNNRHYTCASTSTTAYSCASVRYIFYISGSRAYYITLTGGKTIEDAVYEMTTGSSNANDSDFKIAVDTWYKNNLTDYEYMLEDTPWCNDRRTGILNGWSITGDATQTHMYYAANARMQAATPDLTCETNDAFTVSTANGNGDLTYPVGLLTSDEFMYSGAVWNTFNHNYYLYSDSDTMLITPSYFRTAGSNPWHSYVGSNGELYNYVMYSSYDVRPAVSLLNSTLYLNGNGSRMDPYVVIAS